ncbi:hypothetical protein CDV31_002600 [Fusarium ambrosium]|uniref:Uncharacterized protein n=1 Tax=Fusarium ambrosium TaxID=131363 RepID=A0A428UW01_9HYPO|nr:hypothetical protein CDV31_002600 [Fusarium ambrosium]
MDDSIDDADLGPDSHIYQDDNDMLFFEADESVETDPCLDLEQDHRTPPVFITIHRIRKFILASLGMLPEIHK